ncbi:hypothetical protein [Microcoleus sp. OTE_8_concoct_300]
MHAFGAVNGAVSRSSWQKFGCRWEYLTVLAIGTIIAFKTNRKSLL